MRQALLITLSVPPRRIQRCARLGQLVLRPHQRPLCLTPSNNSKQLPQKKQRIANVRRNANVIASTRLISSCCATARSRPSCVHVWLFRPKCVCIKHTMMSCSLLLIFSMRVALRSLAVVHLDCWVAAAMRRPHPLSG